MDNIGYTSLTRQSGLMREMQTVANNIANASTTGFRREGVVFSEYIHALEAGDPSLSMATANARALDLQQGALTQTGGAFDFAIEGSGFFLLDGPDGQFLTRAGSFTPSAEGELSTPDGYRLLDSGGAPVFVPPDAQAVSVAADGTLSIDGRAVAQIGLYAPTDQNDLLHRDGVRFEVAGGTEPILEGAAILQGFVEGSNVDPITEVARMIEVQRSYELGQKFLEKEDERIRSVLKTVAG
ncbi:flagellar basal-body rod protein FlgF [Aliiroseovarius zhejiangensis]|uniref:Flagellar basal-body rod protein FlgF n=1 Tax=Aliiroseovarius zhejiangensis TaxID=1632025 RepID=A0ABQ3J8A6_9RHOB|nr:flagellar hook-basal body complex protein [Aliiroseovarius zhejiangensis]GHF01942.1 flagellar basal-body rod protein FlgF [Aliiroseovarius zhejiangensis]